MDKYIYDESNGLWYQLQGEYYLSCLTLLPEEKKQFSEKEGITEELCAVGLFIKLWYNHFAPERQI